MADGRAEGVNEGCKDGFRRGWRVTGALVGRSDATTLVGILHLGVDELLGLFVAVSTGFTGFLLATLTLVGILLGAGELAVFFFAMVSLGLPWLTVTTQFIFCVSQAVWVGVIAGLPAMGSMLML